ncbi:MAG: polysaccharide biosynthesis/export family protein, partial [Planctomycetes bacterium]|nr:polysaccharide biosynthesis/export family protein [Planctomycetota bacterium]
FSMRAKRFGSLGLRSVGLCAVGLTAMIPGCYTSLTKPTGVVDYLGRMNVSAGYIVDAPTYMQEYLRLLKENGKPPYRLNVGIRMRVSVYGRGIDAVVNVAPDGAVDLPLIGRIQAKGRTIADFRDEVQKLYAPFFVETPQVSVNVEELQNFGPRGLYAGRVTVLTKEGSVWQRGSGNSVVDLQGDEHLTEILARTGGMHDYTDWKQIAVIRSSPYSDSDPNDESPREALIIVCDLEKYFKEADTRQNIPLRHQDVVFIPTRPNTLLEEVRASIAAWFGILSDVEGIRNIIKRMEDW